MKNFILILSLMAAMTVNIDATKFELFVMQYLPHFLTVKVPPFHREWYSALDDDKIEFMLIEAGRLSAKSTIASVAAPLYFMCERKWDEFQAFSESGGSTGMSTKWMSKIKTELTENQLLIADYGIKTGAQTGEAWTQDHIKIRRGDGHAVDFYCRGKHTACRGGRGVVIIDDPQNSDDVKSETVLTRDEDWLFTDVLPILKEGQRLFFIGTPISPLSLLSKCKSIPEFTVKSFPAEDPPWSGKSRWPEQWSDEYLAKRLSIMGRDRYGAEYLCEPMVPGNPIMRQEWIRSYDPDTEQFERIRRDFAMVITAMDCAESKSDSADYTALVTIGVTGGVKPDVYVLDVRRGRWSTKEGAEQVFLVHNEYRQHKTIVESRVKPPHRDAMGEEIEERERIYAQQVNLYTIRPVKDKVTRAMRVQSIVQDGRFYINPRDKSHQVLRDEMVMFTGEQLFHDDVFDAMVYALTEVADRGERIAERPTGPTIVRPRGTVNPITGRVS